MLRISPELMSSLQAPYDERVREDIIAHWLADLRPSGATVGSGGRERILKEITVISRDEPRLSMGDLTMLADMMLVQAALSRSRP